jgi:hypothetical protein
VRIAALRMIFESHEGRKDGRDPVSMRRFAVLLGRTQIYASGSSTINFHATDSLLRHVLDALLLGSVMHQVKVDTITGLKKKLSEENWDTLIDNICERFLTPTGVKLMRAKSDEERDVVWENVSLLMQHAMVYRNLSTAIKFGDTGRIEKMMELLTVLFQGGKQKLYAAETLEWMIGMNKTWTDGMKKLVETLVHMR